MRDLRRRRSARSERQRHEADGRRDGRTGPLVSPSTGAAFSLLIGGTAVVQATATQSFQGLIDEVRLWHVARTPAQITADMRRELAKTDSDWSQLTDCWPFDEGAGTTTADHAGSFPGTLVNGPTWVTQTAF